MVSMGNGRSAVFRRRNVIALAAAVVIALVATFYVVSNRPEPTAESVVDDFIAALGEGDVAAAAELTTYPNAAETTIGQMFEGLDPERASFDLTQFVKLNENTGFFTMAANWNFGKGKDWGYQVQGGVRDLSMGWRIQWDPSVMAPDLGIGSKVRYDRTDAAPPLIFENTGSVLMNEQIINVIVLDPATMPDPVATTTRRLADVIKPVAPLVTSESMLAEMDKKPGEQVVAVKLRDQDFNYLDRNNEFAIPGIIVDKQPTLITADRRITSPLEDSLKNVWQANRDETAGWAVHIVKPDGTPVRQAGFQGPPGPNINATMDSTIQLAAEDAVVSAGTPSAIVAIQPSTGAVLAAAQNNQAIEQGPVAFEHLYPAGNTLDLVRKAAGLEKGVDPNSLSAEEIEKTGHQLGLGRNYDILGMDQETAVFTASGSGMDQAMNTEGAYPAVTPFGMAMLAASISRGSAPVPMIVHGQPATTEIEAPPLPPEINEQLRNMMRDNVARGGGSYLRGHPGLMGMTAKAGDDRWFFGSRGDFAFAVLVADADGSDRAVKMADRLLIEMAERANQK
ncbi:MAG: penicillin-binding protein [Rhodococcus sp.]|nr:penicillin-binding protein [Rhodococcus sp. (in: high G+C Gram-positive bacteria)]